MPDIVTAAGEGGGPRVRVFSGATGSVLADFFALDPDFLGGVTVAAADLDGDGLAEVAVGAGPGGGPRVRVFDPLAGAPVAGPLGSFFAFDPDQRGGVNIGTDSMAGDLSGDGVADLAVGTGPGEAPRVRVFSGTTGAVLRDLAPFGAEAAGGVRVALSYVTDDAHADLIAGTGPGVAGTVRVFDGQAGGQLPPPLGEYTPFGPSALGGVWVAASNDPIVPGVDTPVLTPNNPTAYVGFTVRGNVYSSQNPVVDTPTGTLTFKAQNTATQQWTTLGTATLAPTTTAGKATAQITYPAGLPAGSYMVTFDYSGGGVFSARTSIPRPVTVRDPQVVIAYPMTKALEVAKWDDAFEWTSDKKEAVRIKGPNPADGDSKNWDFIDRDTSRFNVWAYDIGAWELNVSHLEAKISTTNVAGFTMYDDDATAVSLVRYTGSAKNESGWYWSDSQMLVSNDVDDDLPTATHLPEAAYLQADDQGPGAAGLPKNGYTTAFTWLVSDRTHKVALRGTVKAEYTAGSKTVADTKPVPAKKKVNVHVTAVKKDGQAVIDDVSSNLVIHKANEQYAQVGIYLVPDHKAADANPKNPPTDVNLGNGLDEYPDLVGGAIPMTDEEKALLGEPTLRSAAVNDVELYWVNYLSKHSRGEAFWAAGVPDKKYEDSVIISVDDRGPFTTPHEIGHLLLNSGLHETTGFWPANLMRGGGTSDADAIEASKRLTAAQEALLLSKRTVLLSDP